MELVPPPPVMLPPADTVQLYALIPVCAEYTVGNAVHGFAFPVMTGTGNGFTVTK